MNDLHAEARNRTLAVAVVTVCFIVIACSESPSSMIAHDTGDDAHGLQDATSSGEDPDVTVPDALDLAPDAPPDAPADTHDAASDVGDGDVGAAPLPYQLYVGEADGTITVFDVDPDDAALTQVARVETGGRLNFLAFDDPRERLLAANEDRVESFDISGDAPVFIGAGSASIGGTHLAVEPGGRWVFVASYGGDAVSVVGLGADGVPADASMVLGGGASPNFCRRAHQVRVHPRANLAFVPCLGSDHVAVLRFDPTDGSVTTLPPGETAAGAGPRHMAFHPDGAFAYALGELNNTVTVFGLDLESGAMTPLQTIDTRPPGDDTAGPSSDIHVHPGGAWAYAINRDPRNDIIRFTIGPDGRLEAGELTSTGGDHARTFVLSPTGDFLFVGNSNSQDVVTFSVAEDGALTQLRRHDDFDSRVMFVGVRSR